MQCAIYEAILKYRTKITIDPECSSENTFEYTLARQCNNTDLESEWTLHKFPHAIQGAGYLL